MQLTPLKSHALKTFLTNQSPALVRCRGGFKPASGPTADATVINVRTIRALEADQLVRLDDAMFPSEVRITPRALDVAREAFPQRGTQIDALAKVVVQ